MTLPELAIKRPVTPLMVIVSLVVLLSLSHHVLWLVVMPPTLKPAKPPTFSFPATAPVQ